MAVTIDPRPTYFGDRIIVTGSYTAAAAVSIELSSLMATIDAVIVNPATVSLTNVSITDDGDNSDTLVGVSLGDVATFSGTTITINKASGAAGNTAAGTFLAIGRRS
tara:strand:+ start:278 stop:598 length:321 start_codon:yes stop_codon:yes gene_type:complete